MVVVCIMAKGCIVARVLPLRYFLFLLPNYSRVYAMMMQYLHILRALATGILPTPNTSLSSLPVGSKTSS